MFRTSLIFFVLAVVAFVFGATGIVGIPAEYVRTLLNIFLLVSMITVLAGLLLTSRSSS